jgi:DNA polymerase-3 subunit epsilon
VRPTVRHADPRGERREPVGALPLAALARPVPAGELDRAGIRPRDVERAPSFPEAMAPFLPEIAGSLVLAHNAVPAGELDRAERGIGRLRQAVGPQGRRQHPDVEARPGGAAGIAADPPGGDALLARQHPGPRHPAAGRRVAALARPVPAGELDRAERGIGRLRQAVGPQGRRHDAGEDAYACAQIALAVMRESGAPDVASLARRLGRTS